MGFVGTMRVGLGLGLLAAAAASCGELSDPASPCRAIELGDAEPGVHVARNMAPVLAMTAGSEPFVLKFDCPDGVERSDSCALRQYKLGGLERGNAVMITGSGRFVVATDREDNVLRWYRLDAPRDETEPDTLVSEFMPLREDSPVRLVASLRNSDWIIARDESGDLLRFRPGPHIVDRIAPDHDDMKIVATGEQHAIGRVQHGSEDELFIIPIDDALPHVRRGPIAVMRSGEVTRVVVTPGDAALAVTVRSGADAETYVFAIPTGAADRAVLLDRFSGEMLSGRQPLTELAGMRAVSPDGSRLAFRTARGSLALRNLEMNTACVVQTADKDQLRMAGFSAEGTLYFETERAAGRSQVMAWQPATRELSRLGAASEGFRLAQLPARDGARPWAVGVRDGVYAALQANANATGLALDDAVFFSRDGADVWALSSERVDQGREVGVRRVTPTWDEPARRYDFETAPQSGTLRISGEYVCMSSGNPGAWAYQCDNAGARSFMSAAPLPASEDGGSNSAREPEIPSNNSSSLCGAGVPLAESPSCRYFTGQCCFDNKERACQAAGCDADLCTTIRGDAFTQVICGNQADVGE